MVLPLALQAAPQQRLLLLLLQQLFLVTVEWQIQLLVTPEPQHQLLMSGVTPLVNLLL